MIDALLLSLLPGADATGAGCPYRHTPSVSGRVPGAHWMTVVVECTGGGAEENEKQPVSNREAKSTGSIFSQIIFLPIPLSVPYFSSAMEASALSLSAGAKGNAMAEEAFKEPTRAKTF